MLKFKYCILAAIAAMMVTSCDKNVTMVTEINRDGTCSRQVSTKDDCLTDYDSWQEVTPADTSDNKTIVLRRSFESVQEMAANPILKASGKPIRSNASLDGKFKWFYTDYTFTETFLSWADQFDEPLTDYMSAQEAGFMWTGYPNLVEGMTGIDMVDYLDALQEGIEHWEYRIVTGCQLKTIANNYESIPNPPVSQEEFISLKDSIMEFGYENCYDEFDNVKGLLKDFFKSNAFSSFFKDYDKLLDSDLENTVELPFIKTSYILKMPGRVIDPGCGTVSDGVIEYRFEGGFLIPGDYTITATSRATNVWAFIISGLVILLALATLFYRRK